jgi:hypothetical protein
LRSSKEGGFSQPIPYIVISVAYTLSKEKPMSKSTTRIVLSVLISLVILAGVFTVVQGAALNAGTRGGQVFVDAGLMPDLSRPRSSGAAEALQSYVPESAAPSRSGHGCESESRIHPDD